MPKQPVDLAGDRLDVKLVETVTEEHILENRRVRVLHQTKHLEHIRPTSGASLAPTNRPPKTA